MNIPSLPAKFSIAASLLTICLVGGAAVFTVPSRSFRASANAPAAARTYREGSRLYLDNGTVKVGLETAWGGAIAEIVWHGMNLVNDFDPGRLVQVAQYDGEPYPPCGDCTAASGWDPVQGGDAHKHGSPVVAQTLGIDNIYIKTKPHHWIPENKGGSKDQPVPSDVFIEQTVSFVPDFASGVKVHYKITYFGNDRHANAVQEFPAVYVNWEFGRLVTYDGAAPWTNGPVSFETVPDLPKMTSQLYVSELWEAYVNDQGIGLTLFVPGQPPYIQAFQRPPSAPKNSGTHYCSPRTYFSFGPHSVLEGDVYLFAGDYRQARQTIYSLHKSLPHKDVFAPFGAINEPRRDAKCTGQLNVSGWAMDDTQVSEVNVLLDEHFVGRANYGTPRPDVKNTWPHAPDDVGFKYTLDTTRYPNGKHLLGADVKDPSGNIGSFARVPILIDNPPGADKSN